MKRTMLTRRAALAGALVSVPLQSLSLGTANAQAGDPLPSWNDGATKKAITDFVARVTTQGGKEFVPVAERIATFDNDGTLWCEHPMYFQAAFAMDRVKALAPKHRSGKTKSRSRRCSTAT